MVGSTKQFKNLIENIFIWKTWRTLNYAVTRLKMNLILKTAFINGILGYCFVRKYFWLEMMMIWNILDIYDLQFICCVSMYVSVISSEWISLFINFLNFLFFPNDKHSFNLIHNGMAHAVFFLIVFRPRIFRIKLNSNSNNLYQYKS